MVLGRITRGRHTDNPGGHHSVWTDQQSISINPSPIFMPDALDAATLPIYPGLGQAQEYAGLHIPVACNTVMCNIHTPAWMNEVYFRHLGPSQNSQNRQMHTYKQKHIRTRMWASAQRDGRPAEHRWRPMLNATMRRWRLFRDFLRPAFSACSTFQTCVLNSH